MELELATTAELIQELYNRNTFAGCVVYSDKEHTDEDTKHDTFALMSTIDSADLIEILEATCEAIRVREEQE